MRPAARERRSLRDAGAGFASVSNGAASPCSHALSRRSISARTRFDARSRPDARGHDRACGVGARSVAAAFDSPPKRGRSAAVSARRRSSPGAGTDAGDGRWCMTQAPHEEPSFSSSDVDARSLRRPASSRATNRRPPAHLGMAAARALRSLQASVRDAGVAPYSTDVRCSGCGVAAPARRAYDEWAQFSDRVHARDARRRPRRGGPRARERDPAPPMRARVRMWTTPSRRCWRSATRRWELDAHVGRRRGRPTRRRIHVVRPARAIPAFRWTRSRTREPGRRGQCRRRPWRRAASWPSSRPAPSSRRMPYGS